MSKTTGRHVSLFSSKRARVPAEVWMGSGFRVGDGGAVFFNSLSVALESRTISFLPRISGSSEIASTNQTRRFGNASCSSGSFVQANSTHNHSLLCSATESMSFDMQSDVSSWTLKGKFFRSCLLFIELDSFVFSLSVSAQRLSSIHIT
jgi:hypothetical protein